MQSSSRFPGGLSLPLFPRDFVHDDTLWVPNCCQIVTNMVSTHLPASLNPSLVNVHINHPPEAIVQIHQVARVRGDEDVSEENSVEAVLMPQLAAVPWYTYAHGNGNSIATESRQQQQRAPGLLGRCFREALHGQVRGHLQAWVYFLF